MKKYESYLIWLLVIGGLLLGYQGITGEDILENLLGSQIKMLGNVIIGVAAVLIGYSQLTGKKR